jgi:hypothetical protein
MQTQIIPGVRNQNNDTPGAVMMLGGACPARDMKGPSGLPVILKSLDLEADYTVVFICDNLPHCVIMICVLCCILHIIAKILCKTCV